ncbi:MAG: copper homeostasis protein CutC [Crocinitomicaceae bacterium]|nr:copper homeostasis protein CutC [Crocinitomicaceae bacterium]
MIDLEICTDNYDTTLVASQFGFKRVELCANLNEGGTTPSIGMIQKCAQLKSIEVHAMIRLRPGSFVYSMDEVDIMARDIIAASIAGAKGIVFGCLKDNHEIDLNATLYLAEIALNQKMEFTFHRAIDYTPDPIQTLGHLYKAGFTRVLTSGGKNSAIEGKNLLSKMVEFSKLYPIQIMAGGGVNSTNSKELVSTGIHALHFTARKISATTNAEGMGSNYDTDSDKIKSILHSLI